MHDKTGFKVKARDATGVCSRVNLENWGFENNRS